MKADIMR